MTELNVNHFKKLKEDFLNHSCNTVIQNGVMKNGILDSSQNEAVIGKLDFIFSVDDDYEAVANQNQSGRCWMFSCLNTLRHHIEKKCKIKGFELSQNFTNFYDKLEKANYFYQQIIATADSGLDDRSVRHLLQTPQQDGGDWELIVSIINKYGVVPKESMPETKASFASAELNTILNRKLQQDAITLRKLVHENVAESEINKTREQMLSEVYTILAVALGVPPETVDFEYRDTDKKYHADRGLTPKEYYNKYVDIDLNDYVELINVPIESMPYGKMYTIELGNNMVGGIPNLYLNVEMDTLKECAVKQLQSGEPVWFACDVMQSSDPKKGVMALDLYDLEATFNITDTMTKGQRFEYRESLPTHAMVLGGVDLVDGKSTKWKVENSWGPKVGDKGYFVMDDEWMDQYVYAVAVRKDLLSPELQEAAKTTPIVLPYWNEMYPL